MIIIIIKLSDKLSVKMPTTNDDYFLFQPSYLFLATVIINSKTSEKLSHSIYATNKCLYVLYMQQTNASVYLD